MEFHVFWKVVTLNSAEESAEHLVLQCSVHDQVQWEMWPDLQFSNDPNVYRASWRWSWWWTTLTRNERERESWTVVDEFSQQIHQSKQFSLDISKTQPLKTLSVYDPLHVDIGNV